MRDRPRRDPAELRRRRTIWWWSLVAVSLLAVVAAAYVVRRSGGLRGPAQLKVAHVHALALLPGASLLYVGAHDGVYGGEHLGRRWQKLPGMEALVPPGHDVDAMQVLMVGRWLYAAGHDLGVVRTGDGGKTWQAVTSGLPLPAGAPGSRGRHPDVHALAGDPQQPERLYAWVDGFGLYVSDDGGNRWRLLAPRAAGVDVLALAVDPADNHTVYAGGLGGLASSHDRGRTWQLSLSGFNSQMVTGLWADPATRGRLLATTDSEGLWRSTDGGQSWQRLRVRLPDNLAFVTGNPDKPLQLYLASQAGQLFESGDGGESWSGL